ncbi:hypothetical protein, partial [Bacillus salipaludis]|uniref:hypothetical protein n=1 Tax=Bacillus salipaludis TaxID=2547811 RepID=UPI002E1C52B4|nr:hypothetical protein [Bacillus salipaludis]
MVLKLDMEQLLSVAKENGVVDFLDSNPVEVKAKLGKGPKSKGSKGKKGSKGSKGSSGSSG